MIDLHNALIAGRMIGGNGGSPAPEPVLIEKTITQNGTYNAASDNADGYNSVAVNVRKAPFLKSFTRVGTGTQSYTITFPEEPSVVLGIINGGWGGPYFYSNTFSAFVWGAKRVQTTWWRPYTQNYPGGEINIISYNGLTITVQGANAGAAGNYSGATYAIYYIPKSYKPLRSYTYTGTGETTNTITLPEKPNVILGIVDNSVDSNTNDFRVIDGFVRGAGVCASLYATTNSGEQERSRTCCGVTYDNNDDKKIIITSGSDVASANVLGTSYTVYYWTDDDFEVKTETFTPSSNLSRITINDSFVDECTFVMGVTANTGSAHLNTSMHMWLSPNYDSRRYGSDTGAAGIGRSILYCLPGHVDFSCSYTYSSGVTYTLHYI